MLVNSMGSAQRFSDLEKGDAFLFRLHDEQYIEIKVVEGTDTGAVAVAHGSSGAAANVPKYLKPSSFGLVLSLPELRFAFSPHANDISTGRSVSGDVGKVYLYGPDQEFLSFKIESSQYSSGSDHLLNIRTGEVTDHRDFCDNPVEISRWALVLEMWDRPITLFTYPATEEPLTF
jgi:hypothetical protein